MQALPVISCCRPLAAPSLSDDELSAAARIFKALGDPTRVKILNLLATSGEARCVCELTAPVGLSQPTISHHLKKLTEAGLLSESNVARGRTTRSTPRAPPPCGPSPT